MLLAAPGIVAVDAAGAELPGLLRPRGDSGRVLASHPEGRGWAVLPEAELRRVGLYDGELGRFVRGPEAAARVEARIAPDLPGLARALGMPEGALGWLAAREDAGGRPGGWAALVLQPTTAKVLTGLETDLHGRLLDAAGEPIPGLYAAGEVAGFGHAFDSQALLDSSMVAGAFLTGRVAGRSALAGLGED
jgi:hypothetical protein